MTDEPAPPLCPNPTCGRPITKPLAKTCSRACSNMMRTRRQLAGEPSARNYSREHMAELGRRNVAARRAQRDTS